MKYIVIHNHEYGISTYPFEVKRDLLEKCLSEEEWLILCEILDIDFEPDKEETLELAEIKGFIKIKKI